MAKRIAKDIVYIVCALAGWTAFFYTWCMAISKHMAG